MLQNVKINVKTFTLKIHSNGHSTLLPKTMCSRYWRRKKTPLIKGVCVIVAEHLMSKSFNYSLFRVFASELKRYFFAKKNNGFEIGKYTNLILLLHGTGVDIY